MEDIKMNRHEKALEMIAKGIVIPATPLAVHEDKTLDEKGLRLLMNYYLDCGVGGIATAVHTTQFEIRKPEFAMFEPVLRIVSEEIDKYEAATGKTIVRIAAACGEKEQAVSEARLAKKYGFDAVLLSPGGLAHLNEEELLERARAVAAEMPVVGFYLQIAAGGRLLSYDFWRELCEIDNVIAIKCAPFNRYQTADVVRAVANSSRADQIALYTGNDDNIVIDLLTTYRFSVNGKTVEKGFVGGLLGHWSVWTRRVVEMFEEIQKAKKAEMISPAMLALAAEVTDVNGVFFDANNGFAGCIAGLHQVLCKQGLMKNLVCLDDAQKLSPGQAEEIERVYREYPHLSDDDFVAQNLETWKKRVGL